jgi:hypothetical protein
MQGQRTKQKNINYQEEKKLQSQQIQVHAETAKARQGKLPLFGIGKRRDRRLEFLRQDRVALLKA